jgi:hypothetical protein
MYAIGALLPGGLRGERPLSEFAKLILNGKDGSDPVDKPDQK